VLILGIIPGASLFINLHNKTPSLSASSNGKPKPMIKYDRIRYVFIKVSIYCHNIIICIIFTWCKFFTSHGFDPLLGFDFLIQVSFTGNLKLNYHTKFNRISTSLRGTYTFVSLFIGNGNLFQSKYTNLLSTILMDTFMRF